MAAEGQGQMVKAKALFELAWNKAGTDFEKFTAAHFVARHQDDVSGKLKWDETALEMAVKMNDENMNPSYPSLYLNIGKCYEDLNSFEQAGEYYLRAHAFLEFLPDDGYGRMIKSGVLAGMERIEKLKQL